MTLKVYFDGTNSEIGTDGKVFKGVIVDAGVSVWNVGITVGVSAGWSVGTLIGVSVGWSVGILAGISDLGPKGVRDGDGFGLGVTVGPIVIGNIDSPEPVQAARNNKDIKIKIAPLCRKVLIFSSIPTLYQAEREKPPRK